MKKKKKIYIREIQYEFFCLIIKEKKKKKDESILEFMNS